MTAVAFSPDDTLLFTGDSEWPLPAVGRPDRRGCVGSRLAIRAASPRPCFLPDGVRVLTASLDNSVGQWDVKTGREELSLILKHPGAVTSMALSPDGRYAVTACARPHYAAVGRRARPSASASCRPGEEMVNRGGLLAGRPPGPDRQFGQQSPALGAGERPRSLPAQRGGSCLCRSFGRGGPGLVGRVLARRQAICSPWAATRPVCGTAAAGQEVMRFSPHSAVASASFSPDGKQIVTGSWDNTARIWNAETGLGGTETGARPHPSSSTAPSSHPTGRRCSPPVTTTASRLWDAKTGRIASDDVRRTRGPRSERRVLRRRKARAHGVQR